MFFDVHRVKPREMIQSIPVVHMFECPVNHYGDWPLSVTIIVNATNIH